jgi:hypothetical protein
MEQDCTEIVEKVSALESRFGVVLSAIFAGWNPQNPYPLTVRGELRSRAGSELAETLSINAVAYDDRGRVVATAEHPIVSEDFFEFFIFELSLEVASKPAKVRLFPKKFLLQISEACLRWQLRSAS